MMMAKACLTTSNHISHDTVPVAPAAPPAPPPPPLSFPSDAFPSDIVVKLNCLGEHECWFEGGSFVLEFDGFTSTCIHVTNY